jgi:broad specificity phosphatase PhoE
MIRHGQTVANSEGWASGIIDTPLTDLGKEQAREAQSALRLLPQNPTALYHSALSRARDTAAILNEKLNVPMIECADLNEQNFGGWAGQPWKDCYKRLQAGEAPSDGESRDVFNARVMRGLRFVLTNETGLPLIASHGGVFDALVQSYGYDIPDVKNCHLYGFEPCTNEGVFPWTIWHYDNDEKRGTERVRIDLIK